MAKWAGALVPSPKKSLAAFKAERKAKYSGALQHSTRRQYDYCYRKLIEFCKTRIADFDESAPLSADAVIAWVEDTCTRRKNAGAWGGLVAGAKQAAVYLGGRRPWTWEDDVAFAEARAVCSKIIGIRRSPVTPTGRDKLQELFVRARVRGLRSSDPRRYITFQQLCVALGFVTRPGELMGHKAARAGQCEFLTPCDKFPFGAARMTLTDTKGLRLTNERGGKEIAFAVGMGTDTCPVAALRCVMTTFGLDCPRRKREFIFAKMRPDGTRVFSDPASWLGAAFLPAHEFNAQIKALCVSAQMPAFTARSTRYGATTDMTVAGVHPLVIVAAGRWRSLASVLPYLSMTEAGAAHVGRKLRKH